MTTASILTTRRVPGAATLGEQHRLDRAVEVTLVEDRLGNLEVLTGLDTAANGTAPYQYAPDGTEQGALVPDRHPNTLTKRARPSESWGGKSVLEEGRRLD